ncbi:MAG: endopeptidase La [Myxococcales bacterium]|nr:endopeptidase La [Myxococcales bacterium]
MSTKTTELPISPIPLLPLRSGALFPETIITIPVGRPASLALARSVEPGDLIAVAMQRDAKVADPGIADLLPIVTLARVRSVAPGRPGRAQLVVAGLRRARLSALVAARPFWKGQLAEAEETVGDVQRVRALATLLAEKIEGLDARNAPDLSKLGETALAGGALADVVAAALDLGAEQEGQVLLELDVGQRLELVIRLLDEMRSISELKGRLAEQVSGELSKAQREAFLRQQLKAIQRELGEEDETSEASALRERLDAIELPEQARRAVERELRRLEQIGPQQAEHHVIKSYLELIADLPWDKRADVSLDIDAVSAKLDEDHHGLDDVKKRVLEHLAVRKLAESHRGAVLCLAGPPGVGKTSLGRSVAEATGRPFVRVSLGGVRDEAEIRGHRRTYVGALPGRILSGLRRAGAKNAVMLLDEVDKLSDGWRGSPEAALLEVLDPEQNATFTDHYLELDFDLSEVLFICTANTLDRLSAPLRDRLEVIEIEGYTHDDKVAIARRYLLPKQLERHGLGEDALRIDDAALARIIAEHTREAGVRQLERELTRICRAVTLEVARQPSEAKLETRHVGADEVAKYLGTPRFEAAHVERAVKPGVATGLAWTPVGGDLLYIESSRMPGKGRLEITGQLGDVMKESARAALTYVRSNAELLGVDPAFLEAQDLHIHVPAGAIPKDGPSAGVTIFTALTSLLSERRVRSDTAMTGECTLRGRVLPVGGIKAKVLAAHRSGVRRVVLPERNARDLDEIPSAVRDEMELILAADMSDVLAAALEDVPPALAVATVAPTHDAADGVSAFGVS